MHQNRNLFIKYSTFNLNIRNFLEWCAHECVCKSSIASRSIVTLFLNHRQASKMTIACIADTLQVHSVTNFLNEQRKGGGQFCDVLLKVGSLTLPTHACVLASVSPYFRDLILGERPSSPHLMGTPQEIDLVVPGSDELPATVVAGMLDYIYTGKMVVKAEQLDPLLRLAKSFMLDRLLDIVRRYVDDGTRRKRSCPSGQEGLEKNIEPVRRKQVVTLAVRRPRRRKAAPLVAPSPSAAIPTPAAVVRRLIRRASTTSARRRRKRSAVVVVKRKNGADERQNDCGSGERVLRKSHHKYWFSCTQCKFVTCDVKAVREHKLIHPGRSYVCNSCGFFDAQCAKLLEHLLLANHPETKCSICGIECDDHTAFTDHLRRRHDPRKPFMCSMCDFKCTSRSYLALHTRKHNTDRPYECDVCKAAFKWEKSLQSHKLSHSQEKAFMCDQCDFRTAYKGTLKLHLRRHSGEMFGCSQEGCTYEAYSKFNLRKHMLTHSSEKPYVCEVCGQKYTLEQSLRRHLKVHQPGPGNRLHCRRCDFSTTRGYKLKEHAREVHHIDPPFGRSGVPFPAIAVESFGRVVFDAPSSSSPSSPPPPSSLSEAPPPPPPASTRGRRRRHPNLPPEDGKEEVEERVEPPDDRHRRESLSYVSLGLGFPLFGGYH